MQIIRSLRECRGELVCSQKQYEFCHRALEEVMWGRPASLEELDTWEALTKHKGKRGRSKKWNMFGKKEKGKDRKVDKQKGYNGNEKLFNCCCFSSRGERPRKGEPTESLTHILQKIYYSESCLHFIYFSSFTFSPYIGSS